MLATKDVLFKSTNFFSVQYEVSESSVLFFAHRSAKTGSKHPAKSSKKWRYPHECIDFVLLFASSYQP
jgi:hypothetical protein